MTLYDEIVNNYLAKPEPAPVEPAKTAVTAAPIRLSSSVTSSGTSTDPKQVIPKMEQAQPSYNPGVGAYEQLWSKLYDGVEGEPESQEDIEKREKREKRNSNIFALADALGGVANIWGSIKGATPMDLSSLSEANKKRYDYAKERRERNQEAWRRGMFTAGAHDINAQVRAEERRQAAEERAAAQKYREGQDEIRHDQWQNTYDFNVKQAEERADLDRQKFEELKKGNEEDLKIRRRNIALAERNAEAALNNTSGTGIKKVVRFGMKDGTNITVPDDLKGSYVADVYNKLVDAAGDATIDSQGNTANPILSFMKFQFGQKEPGLSEMMTAIQLYASEYGVEDYMIERANQYTENYQTPVAKDQPAPGSPGSSIVPINKGVMAGSLGSVMGNAPASSLPPLTEDELSEYLLR